MILVHMIYKEKWFNVCIPNLLSPSYQDKYKWLQMKFALMSLVASLVLFKDLAIVRWLTFTQRNHVKAMTTKKRSDWLQNQVEYQAKQLDEQVQQLEV